MAVASESSVLAANVEVGNPAIAPVVSARAQLWHLTVGLLLPATVLVWNMLAVRAFTVDDAYISFRYARNLARGLGLVYNPGERVEGYTNFLWTVLIAAGFKFHLQPEVLAKCLGGFAACVSLGMVYVLSRRIRPYGSIPCVATWLMATSMVQTGYAMFGLETAFFTCLVLIGIELLMRERDRGHGFPYSALVFGLAGLTRPEAPMFIGVPMLFLGRSFFTRQNILRGVIFAAILGTHVLWRHWYYGLWVPNTLAAKTGDIALQLRVGKAYLASYAHHALPALLLMVSGLCAIVTFAVPRGRVPAARAADAPALSSVNLRDSMCVATLMACVAGYVVLVGGDWMPYFRFLSPFEPFAFVLACVGVRAWGEAAIGFTRATALSVRARRLRPVAVGVAVALVLLLVGAIRTERLYAAQAKILKGEKLFWDSAAGGAAYWLATDGRAGEVAIGDIGYVGYETDYPVLDLLGLVDPVISKLPGGYTNKTGSGYVARVFDKRPRYFVFVGTTNCRNMAFPAQEQLRADPRFQRAYRLASGIQHSLGGLWCIFERVDAADQSTARSPVAR